MIDIFKIKEVLIKAGIGPSILSISGYFYAFILLIIAVYYFFKIIIKKL